MKHIKKIFAIVLGLVLAGNVFAYSNLWEYYLDTQGYFPSLSEREFDANSVGIENYTGTAEQNMALLNYFSEDTSPMVFGATTQPIAGMTYNLAGSGLSSSATSIVLQSFTLPQTGHEILDSELSDTFYLTLEPGNRSKQEIVSCTTVTQSSTNDTATLSGCSRGLAPISPYTASSTYAFVHAGGSQVILSDPPQLFNQYAAKANDETITGTWTFNTFPVTPDNSTSTESALGVVELATQVEMASSTATGSTGGPVVIQAQYATSTYNSATAPLRVVVTGNDGKIDQNFVPNTYFAPTGSITAYASTTAPTGWLLANGSAVSRTTYSSLYAVLGTSYGSGDGSTTFNLPNLTGRNIVMASSTIASMDTMNEQGGEVTHTMTEAELVAHTHTTPVTAASAAGASGGGVVAGTTNSGSTGNTTPFNVLDPYIVLNYIIKF